MEEDRRNICSHKRKEKRKYNGKKMRMDVDEDGDEAEKFEMWILW